jgi:hypothetical protein
MPQCQFLFSAVFVFQKSYTGNILGIGLNKARSSYFSQHKTESKAKTNEGQEAATPPGGAPSPSSRARVWCGPLVHPLTSPFLLYILSKVKNLNKSAPIHEKFRSTAAIEDEVQGTEVSIPAHCRDGELPPEPSPSTPPPSPSLLLTSMMRRE